MQPTGYVLQPEDNKLYEGDCLELMEQWDDGCVDHCITDPPYNMSKKNGLGWAFSTHVTMSEAWDMQPRESYLAFTRAWLAQVCRVVKPNGNIFVFGSYHNIYDMGYILNEMGLKIVNSVTWLKPNAQPNVTARMLTESTEHIIWACNAPKDEAKGWTFHYKIAKKLNGGKQMRNVWTIPYPGAKERQYGKHPSQKAIAVIARLMLLGTNERDLVLDCFGGSGTTGVVAQSYNRRWVMIEKQPDYNAIARARLEKVHVPLPRELALPAHQDDNKGKPEVPTGG
jgi:site-specific DNA-methyltransferase (adenine-specific)